MRWPAVTLAPRHNLTNDPMGRIRDVAWTAAACGYARDVCFRGSRQNLIANPSFEATQAKDQFGHVFPIWGGWKYEGDCSFRVGLVSHAGKTSALLACSTAGKIRINQPQDLTPGRYRITAYIRGLDIGTGQWNQTTEFMFNEKYFSLSKSGTFGWSRLTYVAELAAPAKTGPSFGLWAPGMFWIDDVSMERVGSDVKLTGSPVIDRKRRPSNLPARWVPAPCDARDAATATCRDGRSVTRAEHRSKRPATPIPRFPRPPIQDHYVLRIRQSVLQQHRGSAARPMDKRRCASRGVTP